MTTLAPTSVEQIQALVREHPAVTVAGKGTKTGLRSTGPVNAAAIDMTQLAGILEYDASEFTFTAQAGTPLKTIAAALAEHGQYLPFDPPFVDAGATLGGTVAAGLNGPGRLRYGGLRDFIIGARFIDGMGTLVHGGGKVVKNAAGFDLPKLLVGSLGRLGVLTELTFKVFPRPRTTTTLQLDCQGLTEAIDMISRLTMAPLELDAIELELPGRLVVRIAGEPDAMTPRTQRVEECTAKTWASMSADASREYWHGVNAFAWAAPHSLVKIPATPGRIPALDERLHALGVLRRYSVAGNVAWVAWPTSRPMDELQHLLIELKLSGLVLLGSAGRCRLGLDTSRPFALRVKAALDPENRFGELP